MKYLILSLLIVASDAAAQPSTVESANYLTSPTRSFSVTLTPLDGSTTPPTERKELAQKTVGWSFGQNATTSFSASPTPYPFVGFRIYIDLLKGTGLAPEFPMVLRHDRAPVQIPYGLAWIANFTMPLTSDATIDIVLGPDAVPPTAPPSIQPTALGQTAINLSWGAATDNLGVSGYTVERCSGVGCTAFAPIASIGGTLFGDTALAAGTSYSYRVKAQDAAGNVGPYSPVGTISTQAAAPPPPPPAPAQSADCTRMPPATQLLVGKDVWTARAPDADTTRDAQGNPLQVSLWQNSTKRKGSVNYATVKTNPTTKALEVYNYDPTPPSGSGAGAERWNPTVSQWVPLGASQSLIPCP